MSKRISLSSIGVGALWLAAGSLVAVEPIPLLWAAAPPAPASATAPSKSASAPTTTKSSAHSGRLASDTKCGAEQVSANQK